MPTNEGIKPVAMLINGDTIHTHPRHSQGFDLTGIAQFGNRIFYSCRSAAPNLLRLPDCPFQVVGIGVITLCRSGAAGDNVTGEVVDHTFEACRAQVNAREIVHFHLQCAGLRLSEKIIARTVMLDDSRFPINGRYHQKSYPYRWPRPRRDPRNRITRKWWSGQPFSRPEYPCRRGRRERRLSRGEHPSVPSPVGTWSAPACQWRLVWF